jgi:hypothetical protein
MILFAGSGDPAGGRTLHPDIVTRAGPPHALSAARDFRKLRASRPKPGSGRACFLSVLSLSGSAHGIATATYAAPVLSGIGR